MSGGVRNLRAMFENNDVSSSPPDRGRSPAASIGTGSNGTSPRPLSKVRTSFVAVERSGQLGNQLGLKRENSGEPSMVRRRTSFTIDEEDHPGATAERKQSIATEFELRKNSTFLEEIIPEIAIETPSIEVDKQLGGDIISAKITSPAMNLKKATTNNATSNGHTNGNSKPATTGQTLDKPASSKFTARPTPISTAQAPAHPKLSPNKAKSPVAPKTPTTPRGRPKESAKVPEKKAERKENKSATVSNNTAKPTSKPATTAAHGAAAKTRIPPSPPQTGFVKPKPRSPTRPVKLPASLMAHTASSGSKSAITAPQTTTGRQSLSRASGNSQAIKSLQTHSSLSRSPSRLNGTIASKAAPDRKPSTLNKAHGRPSLGPPPSQLKKQPSRQSLPQSAPADEGFLARMMRPTTSSASKTAEKVTTPPKRAPSLKRPVSRDGLPSHEVLKAAAPKMGKLIAKPKSKVTSPVMSSSTNEAKQQAGEEGETHNLSAVVEDPESPAQAAELNEPGATKTDNGMEAAATKAHSEEADENEPAEASILSPVLEHVPDVESTPEKPAPIEELIPAAVGTKLEDSVSVEESAVIELEEEEPTTALDEHAAQEPEEKDAPSKTEDVEAVKETIEATKAKPEPVKEVEIEIPKPIEDPEDVKAREEIARLNAEVLKSSNDEDVE